ncbi:SRPBCC family protein [Microbacterium sp.]|uniref:SRPBCC family protein n=1 Tax=Microbacterium sp. TaxID=51671 RepID=UPI002810CC80|nr:SRPBCC family protein [Microbacterium sp.]
MVAHNVRFLQCSPEAVFAVLRDGWLYPSWVVGASRMRQVDHGWPAVGTRLHHSVGVWPVLIDDTTVSLEWQPPERVVLQARGWPIGEAKILIEVRAKGDGCLVRIHETPVKGPATLIPDLVADALVRWRNAETLRRLGYLAENGAGREAEPGRPDGSDPDGTAAAQNSV